MTYDTLRPVSSLLRNVIHLSRVRSSLMMTYFGFMGQCVKQIEEIESDADDRAEMDWAEIWERMVALLPDILWGSLRDWAVEGIRIFYANKIYEQCDSRTAWKLLKGAASNAKRRISCKCT